MRICEHVVGQGTGRTMGGAGEGGKYMEPEAESLESGTWVNGSTCEGEA